VLGLGSLPMWRPIPTLTFRVFQTGAEPAAHTEEREKVREKEREKIKERESFAQQLPATIDSLFTVGSG